MTDLLVMLVIYDIIVSFDKHLQGHGEKHPVSQRDTVVRELHSTGEECRL